MVTTFLHDLTWHDIPPETQRHAKFCLLDLMGVYIGGRETHMSKIIYEHAENMFSGALALPFSSQSSNQMGLALASGITIDSLDGHDGNNLCKGHVGCGSLAATLAMSQNTEISSAEFLTRLCLGYELGTRLGEALHKTVPDYHTSGAWIAVAAAAIAARALNLSDEKTMEALGIAEYHGPRSQMMRGVDFPTMVKDGSGWGAMAGISASYLAKAGFTGAPALTINTPEELWADLGQNWQIHNQYFKPYPVCRWAQAPIEAALALRKTHNISHDDIEKVIIRSFHQSIRLATNAPRTTEEAQYSTSFPTAIALVKGAVRAEDVLEASIKDKNVRLLAQKTVLIEDDEANAAFPARRFARVTIVMKNGQEYHSDWYEPRWEASAPPREIELIEKFNNYTAPYIDEDRQEALRTCILDLENRPLSAFYSLIAQPIQAHLHPQVQHQIDG